jgi:hypothetical protein
MLSSVNVSQDYQRQFPAYIVVAVDPLRDALADPIESSRHDGHSFGTAGPF